MLENKSCRTRRIGYGTNRHDRLIHIANGKLGFVIIIHLSRKGYTLMLNKIEKMSRKEQKGML